MKLTMSIEVNEQAGDYNITIPGCQFTGKGSQLDAIDATIKLLQDAIVELINKKLEDT